MLRRIKNNFKKIALINRTNSAVKGFIQHNNTNRDLAKYRSIAGTNNICTLTDLELKAALAQRFADRRLKIVPKLKDRLNIFLAYYVSDWENILPITLSKFGPVTEFDWTKHGYHHWASRGRGQIR